jgi:hypothetical protein
MGRDMWENLEKIEYLVYDSMLKNIEIQLPKDSYAFLVAGSFGDIMITLALAAEVKLSVGVVFLLQHKYKLFLEKYIKSSIKVVFIDDETLARIKYALLTQRHLRPALGKLSCTLPTLHPLISELIYTGNLNYVNFIKFLMGMENAAELPKLVKHSKRRPEGSADVKSGRILISGISQTVEGLKISEWIYVACKLRDLGITSVFNIAGSSDGQLLKEVKEKGFDFINLAPEEVPEVGENYDLCLAGFNGLHAFLGLFVPSARVLSVISKELTFLHKDSKQIMLIDKSNNALSYDKCLSLLGTYPRSYIGVNYKELIYSNLDEIVLGVESLLQT